MKSSKTAASVRWSILRKSLLSRHQQQQQQQLPDDDDGVKKVSRKAVVGGGFNLIPCRPLTEDDLQQQRIKDLAGPRDVLMHYQMPLPTPILLIQRMEEECLDLTDFEISTQYNIDTTGLICCWPSEEVLAYFCASYPTRFRSKRVLELGAGYGLAGFVVAACSEAHEVIISDGNPQVVDYIRRNITVNSGAFGSTRVSPLTLHWDQDQAPDLVNTFDIIVASDCTFFKKFHESLAGTIKSLLKHSVSSEAIILSPRRGDSLDKFLSEVERLGLQYQLVENYDAKVWNTHQKLQQGDDISWPNYDIDHCYPLLLRVTNPCS